MADNIFRRKYAKRTVVIGDSFTEYMPIFTRDAVVLDVELAKKVIESFGKMVSSILINYSNINQTQWQLINEHIGNYCSGMSDLKIYF